MGEFFSIECLGKAKFVDLFLFNFWTVLKALNKSSISKLFIYFCPIFKQFSLIFFDKPLFLSKCEILAFDSIE